jgi:hypothetical protein
MIERPEGHFSIADAHRLFHHAREAIGALEKFVSEKIVRVV